MKFFSTVLLLALSATTLAHPTQIGRREACEGSTSPSAVTAAASRSASASAAPTASSRPSAGGGGASGGGNGTTGAVNPSLVPDFGVAPNTNADAKQKGSCDGFAAASSAVTLIPCSCPPSRGAFLAALDRAVAAGQTQGTPVTFNNDAADQSAATNRARATAMLVTLQNLNGPGKGCPAASAPNFATQQKTGTFSSKVFVGPGAAQ